MSPCILKEDRQSWDLDTTHSSAKSTIIFRLLHLCKLKMSASWCNRQRLWLKMFITWTCGTKRLINFLVSHSWRKFFCHIMDFGVWEGCHFELKTVPLQSPHPPGRQERQNRMIACNYLMPLSFQDSSLMDPAFFMLGLWRLTTFKVYLMRRESWWGVSVYLDFFLC